MWLFTAGTDEAPILKKCQAPGYPESDDDKSNYSADDEMSPSSSPCHNNMFDSETEAQSQNSKGMCNIILCLVDLHFLVNNVWFWVFQLCLILWNLMPMQINLSKLVDSSIADLFCLPLYPWQTLLYFQPEFKLI